MAGAAGRWAWGSRLLGSLRDSEKASTELRSSTVTAAITVTPGSLVSSLAHFGSTFSDRPVSRFTIAYQFGVLRWNGEIFAGSRRGLLSLTALKISSSSRSFGVPTRMGCCCEARGWTPFPKVELHNISRLYRRAQSSRPAIIRAGQEERTPGC